MTRVRNSSFRERRETVIGDTELSKALEQANAIDNEYFRLRALAVLSLLRLSGKRRTEISWVQLENFKAENDLLTVTFTLEKKKRKHKKCPNCNTKNSSTASFCKNCGSDTSRIPVAFTSKQAKALKAFPLTDPLTQNILKYLSYLHSLKPFPKFWLPSGKNVFGNYIIIPNQHLSDREVFNIVRDSSETIWPHLFRETVASDIVKQDNSIIAAFKVQKRLDLEDMRTGFNYMQRFAKDIINRETR
ncbi:MAG: zinc ribbon domain-containing protein [Candidatus Bathyarchaeia archaeon]